METLEARRLVQEFLLSQHGLKSRILSFYNQEDERGGSTKSVSAEVVDGGLGFADKCFVNGRRSATVMVRESESGKGSESEDNLLLLCGMRVRTDRRNHHHLDS